MTMSPGRTWSLIWSMVRSEEHTSELQSHSDLVCRLLLEKKKKKHKNHFDSIPPSGSTNADQRSGTAERYCSRSRKTRNGACYVFFLMIPRPPRSTRFPYTTLFRTARSGRGGATPRPAPSCGTPPGRPSRDRKSTRLNSSHTVISYAVFCLKKKKKKKSKRSIKKKKKKKKQQKTKKK